MYQSSIFFSYSLTETELLVLINAIVISGTPLNYSENFIWIAGNHVVDSELASAIGFVIFD